MWMIGTFCSVGASDSARAAAGAGLICTLGLDAAGGPVDGTRLEIPMQNAKCKPVSTRRAHHQTQVEVREKMTASWTWTCFSIDPNQDPQQLGGGGQIFSETHCRMPARRWRDPLLSRWSSSSCRRRRRRSGQVDRCQAVETAGQSTKTDPALDVGSTPRLTLPLVAAGVQAK